MPVSAEFREYVLDQLRAVAPVSARAMFGGVGIYSRGTFFALIADDVLYFKVDETNRSDYEAAGSRTFNPFNKNPMKYFEVPVDVLEDEEQLRRWTRAALEVARKQ